MLIKKLKIADLKPAEYNPRQSTKQQEANLKESLTKFGVVEPIIVNQNVERTNIIIGGHFRVRELKKMGFKEVDCVILDLPLEDEKELNIRLNANTGAWDFDLLANNFDLEDLTTWGLDVPDLGISNGELDLDTIKDEGEEGLTINFSFENKEDYFFILEKINEIIEKGSFKNKEAALISFLRYGE